VAAAGAAAALWFGARGEWIAYGDAEAHLNIARRMVDSRHAGAEQIGTVWLPLPHWLMAPMASVDALWQSGAAAVWPSYLCFVLAGALLAASAARCGGHPLVAAALFALNPNLLYLQSSAMTEPVYFAGLAAALWGVVAYRQDGKLRHAAVAGGGMLAAALTRYEGWFLIPFAALLLLKDRKWRGAVLAAAIAATGPLWWLAHNWWFFGDALEFYRGEWSARAIYARQLAAGLGRYPGDHDWGLALLYFGTAARAAVGWGLVLAGLAGALFAARRNWRPLLLLALGPVFYVWSLHSSGTPIYVPMLWPNSYYNSRYGLAALPLLAFGGALLARGRRSALVVVAMALAPWLLNPGPDAWLCWKESQVNSVARRDWSGRAAEALAREYRGGGIWASFSDLTGILRRAGIPVRESLHEGVHPEWEAAMAAPHLFVREEWAITRRGDAVWKAMQQARARGLRYRRVTIVESAGEPAVELWRLDGIPIGHDLDPLHQGARRAE
jgi:hypothetical protein